MYSKKFSGYVVDDNQVVEETYKGFLKDGAGTLEFKSEDKRSKYLYRHNIRIGNIPQKFSRCNDRAANFDLKYGHNFKKVNKDVRGAIIVDGCFETNKVILQGTKISESETVVSKPRKWADLPDEYKETIEAVIRKLRINKLTLCKKSNMLNNTFDPTTFPGFRFKEILNQETKADAAEMGLY